MPLGTHLAPNFGSFSPLLKVGRRAVQRRGVVVELPVPALQLGLEILVDHYDWFLAPFCLNWVEFSSLSGIVHNTGKYPDLTEKVTIFGMGQNPVPPPAICCTF